MSQIKAIITDVDGVMVGDKEGVDFPLPHKDVLNTLNRISKSGVPIVLCTAKFGNAIKEIALQADLHNPHITDGGAVIIDWLDHKLIAEHCLDTQLVADYVKTCLDQDIYTEIYTLDNIYIEHSQHRTFIARRSKIIQTKLVVVSSLLEIVSQQNIIKVINVSEGSDKTKLENVIREYKDKVNYIWTQHPYLMPHQIMVITAPGTSKQHAAVEVAQFLGVPFDSILGIGDSEADWSFMQLCGYGATIGSHSGKLPQLVRSKGDGHYFIGGSVADHGLLETFKYFDL
jgi:HAD superfamily hydrolase (TIGR01484 family)